jgi:cytochrome P450
LKVLDKLQTKLPRNIHPQWYAEYLQDEYHLGPVIYLDTWPFTDPICLITHPDIANQVTQMPSLPKHPGMKTYLKPIIGEKNLLTLEGDEWKKSRSIFNPGFAGSHLMSLVPDMVKICLVFCDSMTRHAEVGDMFSLEHEAMMLTFDVIGKVAL